MIRLICMVLTAGALCPCQSERFTISGNIAGMKSDTVEIVNYDGVASHRVPVGEDGVFTLTGRVESPQLVTFRLAEDRIELPVYLENKNYVLEEEDRIYHIVSTDKKPTAQNRYVRFDREFTFFENDYNYEAAEYISEGMSLDEKVRLSAKLDSMFSVRIERILDAVRELNGTPLSYYVASSYLFYVEDDFNSFSRMVGILENDPARHPLRDRIFEKFNSLKERQLTGQAPDFELADMEGNPVRLSSFRGQYVLLDFWASWCAPCRKKNRQLNEVYDELRRAGLVIVSVSLDDKQQAWRDAVAEDGIRWTQLIDREGFRDSKIREAYKFEHIPAVYLIGPEGEVLSTNPDMNYIRTSISDHS